MFTTASPYSPFFTAGLTAATKSAQRSFLSLDTNTVAESSRTRSIPSPKPAPSTLLPDVPLKRKVTMASTASTNYRRSRRSDALARLEGRNRMSIKSSSKRSNFMSLTDDEDESDDDDASSGGLSDYSTDDNDVYPYRLAAPYDAQRSSITLVPAEDDSVLLPSPYPSPSRPVAHRVSTSPVSSSTKATTSGRKNYARKRSNTASSTQWFPLKSFIDLRDREEEAAGSVSVQWATWRSFMEIGSVA